MYMQCHSHAVVFKTVYEEPQAWKIMKCIQFTHSLMATRWNMMSVPDWYCITYHLLAIGCIVMRLPGRSKMCSGTYCLFVIWWNCLAEVTGSTGSLTVCWSWMRFGKSIWEKWKQDVLCHYLQSNNVMSLPAERNVQHDSQSICHRMTKCHESPWH